MTSLKHTRKPRIHAHAPYKVRRLQQRREQAVSRLAIWRSLSPQQQLDLLTKRPGCSLKQTLRIVAQLKGLK